MTRTRSEIEVEELLSGPLDDERCSSESSVDFQSYPDLDADSTIPRCHQIFYTPELLLYVFQLMSKVELLASTAVCRARWALGRELLWGRHQMPLDGILRRLTLFKKESRYVDIDAWLEVSLFPSTFDGVKLITWDVFQYYDTSGTEWRERWNTWRKSCANVVASMMLHTLNAAEAVCVLEHMTVAHGGFIFTRLQSITININTDGGTMGLDLPPLSLILSPTVTHIKVSLEASSWGLSDDSNVASLVDQLVESRSRVKSLSVAPSVGSIGYPAR